MTIITWTRCAKCKDCKFLQPVWRGKLKRHICSNSESVRHTQQITLNDLVCDNWQIT